MFYQNNNDYMKDAFYYSQPQNSTYQYNGMNNNAYMPAGNMQNTGMNSNCFVPTNNMNDSAFMPVNSMPNNSMYVNNYSAQPTSLNSMYPQVYKIINPVAQRVISNNNYQFCTEDTVNNMVDTVYNIVEGDIDTLTSTSVSQVSGDDTITQGTTRNATQNSNSNNSTNASARQVTAEASRTTSSSVTVQTTSNNNQLLRDLIKIIILKELLSRPNNNCGYNNFNYGMNALNSGAPSYYAPRCMGMM